MYVSFQGPGTDIAVTVWPISMKFCMMVELRPRACLLSFGGDIFIGLQMWGKKRIRVEHFCLSDTNFCHLTAIILKTVSCSITCQVGLNINWTRAF